ncbi:DUF4194 domain-containing protein [Xylanimonas sp. McL0601]|uniref:DUF4194 domain-containing protein n=1 Tax=Xylanimonas sp. McL0601 TaxID=3414739 RepID=UPI003CE7B1BD
MTDDLEPARAMEPDGFIAPVAMESDPTELFSGDTGTLDPAARVVLVDLLRRRFLSAERTPERWQALLEHQTIIESRLHDVFVTLVVDRDRGIAYKRQVRTGEVDIPILLRDEPYTRVETVLLVQLRTLHQAESRAGEVAARVDAEELEQWVLSYMDPAETNVAARQREVRGAIARLVTEGFLVEETLGRYRITALVEVVLPVDRLAELADWLRGGGRPVVGSAAVPDDEAAPGDAAPENEEDDE